MSVSENPNPLLLNDQPDMRPVALLQANGAEGSNGDFGGAMAMAPPSEAEGPDLAVYLHALRRHWLLSLGIGLLCAVILGPLVWFIVGDKYTAYSLIAIAASEHGVLIDQPNLTNKEVFEIYKATQEQKLLSRFVVTRALRNKPELTRYLVGCDDPVRLASETAVDQFSGKGGVDDGQPEPPRSQGGDGLGWGHRRFL